jgi:hypothetical protein
MDVDHAGELILIIWTRDASVAVGTLTILIIEDIEGFTATGILTGMVIGAITTGTCGKIEPGVGAAARRSHSDCTAWALDD